MCRCHPTWHSDNLLGNKQFGGVLALLYKITVSLRGAWNYCKPQPSINVWINSSSFIHCNRTCGLADETLVLRVYWTMLARAYGTHWCQGPTEHLSYRAFGTLVPRTCGTFEQCWLGPTEHWCQGPTEHLSYRAFGTLVPRTCGTFEQCWLGPTEHWCL